MASSFGVVATAAAARLSGATTASARARLVAACHAKAFASAASGPRSFVVPASPVTSLSVQGGAEFPVRRIYCVGRNYWEHAIEMGGAPEREPPFVFHKPTDAAVDVSGLRSGGEGAGELVLPFPSSTAELAYEAELVLALGRDGEDVALSDAASFIWGYGVGVDLTRRDLQAEAKKLSRPWCTSKGFDRSAPIGALVPSTAFGGRFDLEGRKITMKVNGESKQEAELSTMIWNPVEIVMHISRYYRLMPGDLVFTGTPAGVGRLSPGDLVDASVDGLPPCTFRLR